MPGREIALAKLITPTDEGLVLVDLEHAHGYDTAGCVIELTWPDALLIGRALGAIAAAAAAHIDVPEATFRRLVVEACQTAEALARAAADRLDP